MSAIKSIPLILLVAPALYLIFFGGLLFLTVIIFRKLSTPWKFFSAVLWLMILGGHVLAVFAVRFEGASEFFMIYWILAAFMIGLGIVGFALPLASVRPVLKSNRRAHAIALVTTLIAWFVIGIAATGPVRQVVAFLLPYIAYPVSFILILSLLGLVAVYYEVGTLNLAVGVILFVFSFIGFMTIGIYIMPVALLFLASGILLQASASEDGKRLS